MGALRALSVSKYYAADIRALLIKKLAKSLKNTNSKMHLQAFIDGLIGIGHGGDLHSKSLIAASLMLNHFK
jgi:hypothetical protein